ncbi:hypothetical protein GCM10009785_11150 [Brooklawnia cerclae]|uniref:GT2 family glycosyltransferase n=1 Tax=Brooklawnia cerclae TaxID=349934 RepID=A0ABX0SPG5_9ACTN|nr:glycosyltransferase [Brooklawnia cerclae]NIH58656.1 GT2 family glycosyltransferase [Brooklawnia cerclae]
MTASEHVRPDTVGRGRVSVCMATWNGSEFIYEQITSILSELRPDDEVVVVDDASQDNTVALLRGLGDPRIKIFPQPMNRGYVRTFEKALSLASGDYVFLSDQDDVWVPGRVDAMVEALQDNQVVATNLATLNGPARIGGPFGIKDWRLRSGDSRRHAWNLLVLLSGLQCYWGCAMAVRRDALDYLLPFPPELTETHDQWIGLCGNMAGSIAHLDERTVLRRYHGDNLTPAQPRGVLPALRSRVMLIRCLGVARRRGLGHVSQLLRSAGAKRTPSEVGSINGRAGATDAPPPSTSKQPHGSRVAIVVSLYNPPGSVVDHASRWIAEIGPVIAVDDGSPSDRAHDVLERLKAAGAHVIAISQNSGIAHALNIGIKHALTTHHPDWILTMDQDSDLDADYVTRAFRALRFAPDPSRVGMLCAESLSGVRCPSWKPSSGIEEPLDPTQSGTLIRASLFSALGFLLEPLFIDSVDSEFNARARQQGWVLLLAPGCNLLHSLGKNLPAKVMGHTLRRHGKPVEIHYHPPFRVYYMARNYIFLLKRYAASQPSWIARKIRIDSGTHIINLICGPNRIKHLEATAYGVFHGLTGHFGPIDPHLAHELALPKESS